MKAAFTPDRDAVPLAGVDAATGEGVHALMRAVLLDAIMCLRARCGPEKDRARLARDARQWMVSTGRTWPFSFESVCDELGVSASYIRTLLLGGREPLPPTPADAGTVEDIVRRLSTLRMRGNRRTRVVANRRHRRRRNRGL
jgi:hypothetical protein